jgi:6-phosphogluconolactonase
MKPKWIISSLMLITLILTAGTSDARQNIKRAVYAMTNDPVGNAVVLYTRNAKGMLTEHFSYPTGGMGSGGAVVDPLGSQGSLVLSSNKRWLIAVNAGSDEISVFRVRPKDLVLTDVQGSGGVFPVSLSLHKDLLYVLNAGVGLESPNISGFSLSREGKLTALEDSARPLGVGAFSQVGFDPKGTALVITQRDTNEIHVFSVGKDGLPSETPITSDSVGEGPFGFIFDQRGHLLVSEAGTAAVSSYEILPNNTLDVLSPSVVNGETATCWIAGNQRGFAFTANTGTSTISAYSFHPGNGNLALLEAVAATGNLPIDLATSGNGRFLYVLNAGDGTIGMFKIQANGNLTDLGFVVGLPFPFAQGIAAR